MLSPLAKRFPRELKSNLGKYLGIFFMMVMAIGLTSGFLVAASSISKIIDKMVMPTSSKTRASPPTSKPAARPFLPQGRPRKTQAGRRPIFTKTTASTRRFPEARQPREPPHACIRTEPT